MEEVRRDVEADGYTVDRFEPPPTCTLILGVRLKHGLSVNRALARETLIGAIVGLSSARLLP